MEIILDTANIKEIQKWAKLVKATHVTTNPHLLKEAGIDSPSKLTNFIKDIYDANISHVFFQCVTPEDVEKLDTLRISIGLQCPVFVVKVTMLPEFYPVIEKAMEKELKISATTCYDLVQIHQACEMNLDYTMVYFAKNENETLLSDAVNMKEKYDYITNLVAASFRTKKDFITAIKSGIDYATVRPETLELAYQNLPASQDASKL